MPTAVQLAETRPKQTRSDPPDIVAAPGETVFSIMSRYHRLSGNRSPTDSLFELCGTGKIESGNALPGHLACVFARLGLDHDSPVSLIEQHTILPYWKPFIPVARYRSALYAMQHRSAASLKLMLGMTASGVGGANPLRYCDICGEEDRLRIGVPIWHRVHHLPGVWICPYHGTLLHESRHLSRQLHRHALFLPDQGDLTFTRPAAAVSSDARRCLMHIAQSSLELLSLEGGSPAGSIVDAAGLRQRYLAHLERQGLTVSPTRVDSEAMQGTVKSRWLPLAALDTFGPLLASTGEPHGWLAGLPRKPRRTRHPLKHLLLIGAIAPSVQSFFALHGINSAKTSLAVAPMQRSQSLEEQVVELMRDGCFSATGAARQLGIDVHTTMKIAQRHGIAIARRPKRIVTSTRAAIRTRLAHGEPLQQIASEEGVSAITVSRVLSLDPKLQQTRREAQAAASRQAARKQYLAAKTHYPDEGPTALREREPGCYAWLYRHDRDWLMANAPAVRPCARVAAPGIDWKERDSQLAQLLRIAAEEILASAGKPIRVSKMELGRRTGRISWLRMQRTKLPLSCTALCELVEPVSAFQRRRLLWWEQRLWSEEGVPPAPSRVRRLAGVASGTVSGKGRAR